MLGVSENTCPADYAWFAKSALLNDTWLLVDRYKTTKNTQGQEKLVMWNSSIIRNSIGISISITVFVFFILTPKYVPNAAGPMNK